jgi:hypothetical protein
MDVLFLKCTYLKLKRGLLPCVSHLHLQPQPLFFLADTLHEVANLLQPLHRYGMIKKIVVDLFLPFYRWRDQESLLRTSSSLFTDKDDQK